MIGNVTEISVSTAALMVGCSRATMLRWIEEGRISPRGWWKVNKKSLALYLYRQTENR